MTAPLPDVSALAEELGPEAEAAWRFLAAHEPALAPGFLAALPAARRSLLERLVSALYREDVQGFASEAVEGGRPAGGWPAGCTPPERPLRLALPDGHELVLPVAATGGFRRLALAGAPAVISAGAFERIGDPAALIGWLERRAIARGGPVGAWGALAAEMADGVANLAMAYAHDAGVRAALAREARALGAASCPALVAARRARDPAFDASLFYEQRCLEGHPLHPGAKTRLGLGPEAAYRYGPEFGGSCEVRLVALLRERAEWTGPEPNAALFAAAPALAEAAAAELAERGLALADYVLVPVHPWQLKEVLPAVYPYELQEAIMVPLERASLPMRPTASFRTLVPAAGRGSALKLAINSQMTSTVRSISPQTAHNGPAFSRLIGEILAREPQLPLVPVNETAGVCWRGESGDRARNMTAIWRERVEALVAPDEQAIVAAAFLARSPLTEQPLLLELVDALAAAAPDAAKAFLERYVGLLVPAALTLLVKYGLALEAHMQNCVPVFRDGAPVRMLIRDWGGLRLYAPRLERQGLTVRLREGSVTRAATIDAARSKLYYTLYQNHLAELVWLLVRAGRVEERAAWRLIRRVSEAAFAALSEDPALAAAAEADRRALFAPEAAHKALTLMRLQPEGGDRYCQLPNPLAEVGP